MGRRRSRVMRLMRACASTGRAAGRRRRLIGGAALALCLVAEGSHALMEEDTHIMYPDDDPVQFDIDQRTFQTIRTMLITGYPLTAVLLRGVALGIPIDFVTNLVTQSQPERVREIYDTAIRLMPSLPGWSCRGRYRETPFYGVYRASDLGERPTLTEIARRYFEEDLKLTPFPRWLTGAAHVSIPTRELAELIDPKLRWYSITDAMAPDALTPRPVFVALYKDEEQIVVDANLEQIGAALQSGVDELPVVIVYNQAFQQPVARFADPTLKSVSEKFFDEGVQLTPVPLWEEGDHHFVAQMSELKNRFDLPGAKDIGEDNWLMLEADMLDNGFVRPALITLYEGGERMWLNDPERVAMAEKLGFTELPVVMFYHALDRLPCGDIASCDELVCCAARAGEAAQRPERTSTLECQCGLEAERDESAGAGG